MKPPFNTHILIMGRKGAKLNNAPQGQKRAREDVKGESQEKPVKRKRQANNLSMVELYNDLAAESEDVRLEAAKQMIMKFSPEAKPTAADVLQALNRLISGLCTDRKAARFGFCITLTELLRLVFSSKGSIEGLDLEVNSLLKKVEKNTKVEGNVSGKVRDQALIKHAYLINGYRSEETILSENYLLTRPYYSHPS